MFNVFFVTLLPLGQQICFQIASMNPQCPDHPYTAPHRHKRAANTSACGRCTLMTGRHLGHCTIRGNDGAYSPFLATDVTVAKLLQQHGYHTGLVGKVRMQLQMPACCGQKQE